MTKIEITNAEPRYTVTFDGHATGSAEVCAGVSALMFSLEGYLRNHDKELFLHSARVDKPGWAFIRFELEEPAKDIKGAFEMFTIGVLQIAETYPDFCQVTVKEIKK